MILKTILKAFHVQLLTPENLAPWENVIEEERKHANDRLERRRNELLSRLAAVRRRITNITEIMTEQGGAARTLLSRLGDLEGEETETLSALSLIDGQPQQVDVSYSETDLRILIGQFSDISKIVNPIDLKWIFRSMIRASLDLNTLRKFTYDNGDYSK